MRGRSLISRTLGHYLLARDIPHKGLHPTNANFNALVEDLQDAMDECAIAVPAQNRFLAGLAPMQHQVVTR
jgi:hemoglobin